MRDDAAAAAVAAAATAALGIRACRAPHGPAPSGRRLVTGVAVAPPDRVASLTEATDEHYVNIMLDVDAVVSHSRRSGGGGGDRPASRPVRPAHIHRCMHVHLVPARRVCEI